MKNAYTGIAIALLLSGCGPGLYSGSYANRHINAGGTVAIPPPGVPGYSYGPPGGMPLQGPAPELTGASEGSWSETRARIERR